MTMKRVKESNVNTTSVPKLRPSGSARVKVVVASVMPPFCDTIFRKCTDLMRQRTGFIF